MKVSRLCSLRTGSSVDLRSIDAVRKAVSCTIESLEQRWLLSGQPASAGALLTTADTGSVHQSVLPVQTAAIPATTVGPVAALAQGATAITNGSSTAISLGSAAQGQSATPVIFTLTNNGDTAMSVGTVSVPTGFTLASSPAGTVAAGASTTFSIQLNTTIAGNKSGQVSFATSDANANPFTFNVSGVVTAPAAASISVTTGTTTITDGSSTPVDFGSVTQGGVTSNVTFTVSNSGTAALTLGTVSVPAGYVLATSPASSVAAGSSTTFAIHLNSATSGTKAGAVSFTTSDSNHNPFTFNVTGQVNNPAVASIGVSTGTTTITNGSSTAVDFGAVTQGAIAPNVTFTVTNSGTASLTMGSVSVPTGFVLASAPATTVAAGASTTFALHLDSTGTGTKAGQVSFATNDANNNPFTFNVTGVVNAQPTAGAVVTQGGVTGTVISNGSSNINLGSIVQGGTGPSQTFTISNTGTANMTVGTVSVPAGFTLVSAPGTSVTHGGGSTSFVVQLNSTTVGAKQGTVSFTTSDPNNPTFTFTVSGTVTAPLVSAIGISAPSGSLTNGTSVVDFGSEVQGTASPTTITFTVQNTGSGTLTLGSVVAPTGFSVIDVPASSVAPGGNTTFTLRLDGINVGKAGGTVSITNNDPNNNPFTFTVKGVVTAPLVPQLTVALGATTLANNATTAIGFGTLLAGATGTTRTFTLTDTGTAALTIGTVSVPGGFILVSGPASSLSPGGATSFTIQLDTSNVGTFSGSISFTDSDTTNTPFNIAVSGVVNPVPAAKITVQQGTAGLANNDPAGVDFGSVVINQTDPTRTFTITNSGTANLVLGTVSVPSGFILQTAPGTTVAAGQSTTFTVALDSTSNGAHSGQISFTDNDSANNPFVINVTGTVTGGPEPHIALGLLARKGHTVNLSNGSGTPVAIGTVLVGAAGPSITLIVSNTGTAALNLASVTVPNGLVITGTTPNQIAAGSSANVTIQLSTTSAVSVSGAVSFTSDDPQTGTFNVNVTANVVTPAPNLVVSVARRHKRALPISTSGATYNMGSVFQGAAAPGVTFYVSNTGTAQLRTYGVSLPSGFTASKLPKYLAPGQTATFAVYLLTNSVGSFGGSVQIPTSDPHTSNFIIPVSGTVNSLPAAGSVTASFNGSTLTVTGSDHGDDVIVVGGRARAVYVTNNGASVNGSPFNGVTKIVVNLGGGNASATLNSAINGTINGGPGRDTLQGGPANDVLNAGSGNSVLMGGSVSSTLLGGSGSDTLIAGSAPDVLKAGSGPTVLNSQNGIADQLVQGKSSDTIHSDRVDPVVIG